VGVPLAGVRGVLVTLIRLDRGVRGSPEAELRARLGRVTTEPAAPRVRQLRLVVEAADFEAAAAFYRDALGLPVELDLEGEAGEHVLILDAGRATLELSNPAQVAMIDEVEVGRRVAPRLRVAFEVDDAASATVALVDAGAELVAPPTRTPWDSLNSRLEAPELQITLFEERGRGSS
jgi:catechol 2,3-dioxygenase-like lactoylglutathione lyase family enzyme